MKYWIAIVAVWALVFAVIFVWGGIQNGTACFIMGCFGALITEEILNKKADGRD